ncbi:MAG: GNAT family N-acetyltransferase [Clostridia bacterium]|nr:GNAT family N-acetyltransferase [Clostridia bacterium]
MKILLQKYNGNHEATVLRFIVSFFRAHHADIGDAQAREDLACWTDTGHELYDILCDGKPAGFLHLNMRGSTVCWIEDIFVAEHLRGQGIASEAIRLAEGLLQKRGVTGVCMDVVPDNIAALKLYHRLGYDRLSTVTVRKDFQPFETDRAERIAGMDFRVKKFD